MRCYFLRMRIVHIVKSLYIYSVEILQGRHFVEQLFGAFPPIVIPGDIFRAIAGVNEQSRGNIFENFKIIFIAIIRWREIFETVIP